MEVHLMADYSEKKNDSVFYQCYVSIKNTYINRRKLFYFGICSSFLLSSIISGYMVQVTWLARRVIRRISFWKCIPASIIEGKLILLLFFLILNYLFFMTVRLIYKDQRIDKKRNIRVSEQGTDGTSDFMDEKEKEENFSRGKIDDITDNICGCDPEDNSIVYGIKPDRRNVNGHALIIAGSRGGKTRCIGYPWLEQIIRRKESCIFIDPKGAVYNKTHKMAEANGMKTYVLSTDPRRMEFSDTTNLMSMIHGDYLLANSFATVIMENTSADDNDNAWAQTELDLLAAHILYVDLCKEIPPEKKNIGYVAELIRMNSIESMDAMFTDLPHYMKIAEKPYAGFREAKDDFKKSCRNGLLSRLKTLNSSLACHIIGTDGIQISDIGKEPTIIYVVIPDTDNSTRFMSALFFSLVFQELGFQADMNESNNSDGQGLDVKVTIIADEFKNIGKLPGYDTVLSTFAGRNVDIVTIVQSVTQLVELYPETWESIVNNCDNIFVLKANSNTDCEYISKMAGIMTAVSGGKRYNDSEFDQLKIHANYMMNEMNKPRNLLNPDEIRTMSRNQLLYIAAYAHPIFLDKYDYTMHPMSKEMVPHNLNKHVPEWKKNASPRLLKDLGVEPPTQEDIALEEDLSQVRLTKWHPTVKTMVTNSVKGKQQKKIKMHSITEIHDIILDFLKTQIREESDYTDDSDENEDEDEYGEDEAYNEITKVNDSLMEKYGLVKVETVVQKPQTEESIVFDEIIDNKHVHNPIKTDPDSLNFKLEEENMDSQNNNIFEDDSYYAAPVTGNNSEELIYGTTFENNEDINEEPEIDEFPVSEPEEPESDFSDDLLFEELIDYETPDPKKLNNKLKGFTKV